MVLLLQPRDVLIPMNDVRSFGIGGCIQAAKVGLLRSFLSKIISSGWCFQMFFMFIPSWGRWTHFDSYFSSGLVQPPTSKVWSINNPDFHPCTRGANLQSHWDGRKGIGMAGWQVCPRKKTWLFRVHDGNYIYYPSYVGNIFRQPWKYRDEPWKLTSISWRSYPECFFFFVSWLKVSGWIKKDILRELVRHPNTSKIRVWLQDLGCL